MQRILRNNKKCKQFLLQLESWSIKKFFGMIFFKNVFESKQQSIVKRFHLSKFLTLNKESKILFSMFKNKFCFGLIFFTKFMSIKGLKNKILFANWSNKIDFFVIKKVLNETIFDFFNVSELTIACKTIIFYSISTTSRNKTYDFEDSGFIKLKFF